MRKITLLKSITIGLNGVALIVGLFYLLAGLFQLDINLKESEELNKDMPGLVFGVAALNNLYFICESAEKINN